MSNIDELVAGRPKPLQGVVVTADATSVTVKVGASTYKIRRTTSLALKPGDRVNINGGQIVGKRKPPPTGATYEI
jgi:hypothetical protein